MASRGLIGLAGGLGAALNDNAAFLGRQEERQQTFADNVKLQGWLQQMRTDAQIATEQRAEDRKNKPLLEMQGLIGQAAKEEVPVTAEPITSLAGGQGKNGDSGVPLTSGFRGDPNMVRGIIEKWPDGPDKDYAMAQLQSQVGTEQQAAQDAVAGQTRPRTQAEAMHAARTTAMSSNLPALAAFETSIGKPMRDEQRAERTAATEQARVANAGAELARKERADERRYQTELARLDLQGLSLEAQNRKTDALIEHWGNQDDAKANAAGKAGSSERMYSIVNSMNATIKNLNENKPTTKATPAEKEDWQRQLDGAVKLRDKATARLNEMLDGNTPGTGQRAAPGPTAPPTGNRPPLSSFFK